MLAQPPGIEWELGLVLKWDQVLLEMVVKIKLDNSYKELHSVPTHG